MSAQSSIRAIGFISASMMSLVFATTGFAQQAATEAPAKGDQLEEITVTAQKRESTVETTPISITALTGVDLQDRGITDISGVVQSVPGVSMRSSGPGQTELEMRGMLRRQFLDRGLLSGRHAIERSGLRPERQSGHRSQSLRSQSN